MTNYHSKLFEYLQPDNYSKLSDEDKVIVKNALYLEIRTIDWSPLSNYPESERDGVLETRHGLLQSLENLNAFEQGRPAKELVFLSPSDRESSLRNDWNQDCTTFGYWSPHKDIIVINDDLVSEGRMDTERNTPECEDTKLQLIDTVIHEGRHAYQSYAIEHPSVHGDTPEARKEVEGWAKNEGKYYSHGLRYYVQPQEADAYSYAREKINEVFGDDLKDEKGFAEYNKLSEETEAKTVLDEIAYKENTSKENVINKMDEEMIEGCNTYCIAYSYDAAY